MLLKEFHIRVASSKQVKSKFTKNRMVKKDIVHWSEEEKNLLADAIDMYGMADPKRLASYVGTKTANHVLFKLSRLRIENRKEMEYQALQHKKYIDLNAMEELFVLGSTKPKEALSKWINYLEHVYNREPFQYNKFKLFSNSFLIMSECAPPPKSEEDLDFRKVYYALYRVFNDFYLTKNQRDVKERQFLHEMFFRVLEDIECTSDNEKLAMHNIASKWADAAKLKPQRVYGNTKKCETTVPEEDTKPILRKTEFRVLDHPKMPSLNPFCINSCTEPTVISNNK